MPEYFRISSYRIMWLFVFFDLPVGTKKQRKAYQQFHKGLLKEGFTMKQYSVYIRHCGSRESLDAKVRRVKNLLPKEGSVSIMEVTDKQFERIQNFWGVNNTGGETPPAQLQMF